MKKLTGAEIRTIWLDFWKTKGHAVLEGASLVPQNDKSLLWMNAGVAALKKYFDGRVIPTNPRICNVQKCIRTNDIENVGETARHHTFFEMLGNFSIGDYFRDEAIEWGFEILTSPKYFGIDLDKLYFTVYPSDNDTFRKWTSLGVNESHIIKCEGNFWEIGVGEGPSGPDTEIFFDRGEEFGDFGTEVIENDIENDRYIEIWNIVFSQYNAQPGVSRSEYKELPHKNIDTGMGLERMASILQGAKTNFETDLFMPIIDKISKIANVKYNGEKSFKVIADHVRTVTFAISDGALFSNEGRGYVLRRLLRRAVKHGMALGIKRLFLSELVDEVINVMSCFYPYLENQKELVKKLILAEEIKFHETIENGLEKLKEMLKKDTKVVSGSDAFLLYDTYGFPIELTIEYAEELGLKVDLSGFELEMEKQKERARKARADESSFQSQNDEYMSFHTKSTFVGYEELVSKSFVTHVFKTGICVDKTPFYAECGGQVGDVGVIVINGTEYQVIDTKKLPNGQHLHILNDVEGISELDVVELIVDKHKRVLTTYNHSCTHILFKVLRDVLGAHVSQQGSEVSDRFLRFDFNHYESISDEKILEIEKRVNEILKNSYVQKTRILTIDEAKKMNAIAEFGEKYEEKVRVVDLGATIDVCGGTHVDNVKNIRQFMVVSISSIGSGIYRILGLTNEGIKQLDEHLKGFNQDIVNLVNKANQTVQQANDKGIKVEFDYEPNHEYLGSYQDIINKRIEVKTLQGQVKDLEKNVNKLLMEQEANSFDQYDYLIDGNVAIGILENVNPNVLKNLVDDLASKMTSGTVFIANVMENKVIFIAKTTNQFVDCGKLVKEAAQITLGNGGGRKDFAQAGGKDVTKVDEAMAHVRGIICG